MLVRAIRLGYYDHVRRRPGDIFDMREVMREKDGLALIDKDDKGNPVPKRRPLRKDEKERGLKEGPIQRPSWVEDAAKKSSVIPMDKPKIPVPMKSAGNEESGPATSPQIGTPTGPDKNKPVI